MRHITRVCHKVFLTRIGHRGLMTGLTRQTILLTGSTRRLVQVPPLMWILHQAFSLRRLRGLDDTLSFYTLKRMTETHAQTEHVEKWNPLLQKYKRTRLQMSSRCKNRRSRDRCKYRRRPTKRRFAAAEVFPSRNSHI